MQSKSVAFVRQRQGAAVCFSFARRKRGCYLARPKEMSAHQNNNGETGKAAAQLKAAAEILEKAVGNRALLAELSEAERTRLLTAAGAIYCPDVNERRRLVKAKVRRRKAEKIQRDESKLNETGIRKLRREKVFTTPNVLPPKDFEQKEVTDDPDFREVVEPQNCYICKKDYSTIHHFYDQLCPACAELNLVKRTETADLRGRVALLTGGRVKIGYQAGIKLLRAGAQLIVSTRFPRDSAMRYSQEPDFAEWENRLEIFGLDLRHTPSVEAFCRHLLATRNRLDFIINNACQTVRRPPDFYQHMMESETGSLQKMPGSRAQIARRLRRFARLSHFAGRRNGELRTEASLSCYLSTELELLRRQYCFPDSRTRRRYRKCRCCRKNSKRKKVCFPKASWIRICSRLICAKEIPGACSWPKFRPLNCWKCNSSTPSRRSFSMRD